MAHDYLRETITRLAAIDRTSCSPGEHEAAQLIADDLRKAGAQVTLERPRIHGTYWWPLGITSAIGIAAAGAAVRGRRWLGAALGAAGAALVFDELGAGRRWLRAVLPKHRTTNVVAVMGDPDAEQTLLLVAHHDAAHSGVFFNPRIAEHMGRRLSELPKSQRGYFAPMAPIAAAPDLAGVAALIGSRPLALAAGGVCAGIIGSFVHIARSPTVPGANDNLSGVATLLALARTLASEPVRGLRVMLVSTGSEEALMEGMRAFFTPRRRELSTHGTHVLCVDAVGSRHLVLIEAEGMLTVRRYDERFKDLIEECAADAQIPLRRGHTMRLGTDGYVALRNGVPAAALMSVNDFGAASNYHWPTDTADRVDYETVQRAVSLCELVVRRMGAG
ncbi:MAG TPA: M28 family peptidase [Solirubrobacteraceae bacterium]|nr:M28 family peptidase [Solirubrobacteraceae bacterium]